MPGRRVGVKSFRNTIFLSIYSVKVPTSTLPSCRPNSRKKNNHHITTTATKNKMSSDIPPIVLLDLFPKAGFHWRRGQRSPQDSYQVRFQSLPSYIFTTRRPRPDKES